jgi:dihydropyrimidine dehydrogenase (NAD+) subunit PreA
MKIDNRVDISVDFCGFHLENPFMLSSAPPAANIEMIQRAFDAGWGGAVTKTLALTATQNVMPRFASLRSEGKMIGFENIEQITDRELEEWLPGIRKTKQKYPNNLLVASLMAPAVPDEWHKLVQKVQSAGPDMIELNLSCPHMAEGGIGSAIGQDPRLAGDVTKWVKEVAEVPVMVKLTPNVTDIISIGNAAKRNGADALSAINTVLSMTGIDLDTMEPKPSVKGLSTFGGFSGPSVKPISLRIAVQLAKGVGLPLSSIGGITTWRDAAEFLMCGATTMQLCTAVMWKGYGIIEDLTTGLSNYLYEKDIGSVKEIIGHALPKIYDSLGDLDFAHKVVFEIDKTKCIKCGLCYVACRDGGYDAIELDEERVPTVDEEKCDGCSLCMHVCPVWDCVKMKTVEK